MKEVTDENAMRKNDKSYNKHKDADKNIDESVIPVYEQCKADAKKQTAINTEKIDMSARTNKTVVEAVGMKVTVLGGEDSSRLKFKIRK